jgi:hypothetical protein
MKMYIIRHLKDSIGVSSQRLAKKSERTTIIPMLLTKAAIKPATPTAPGSYYPHVSANKGCRIWYKVVALPGMAAPVNSVEFSRSGNSQAENLPRMADFQQPPTNPKELHPQFFTKRKKDVIPFDFGDGGKTVYMSVQVENEGKAGPEGPLVSALIP